MSDGKSITINLIAELIKKILLHKMSYFLEPHTNENKVKLN